MARALSEAQRGILASSMSAASAGLMLGRSAAWVERMRGELVATARPAGPRCLSDGPAPPPPEPALKQRAPEARAVAPKEGQPPAASRQPPAASRGVAQPSPSRKREGRVVSALKQRAAAPRAMAPLKPDVRRWARWFLAAGWSPREVAHLFDLKTADLQAALGGSA